MDRTTLQTLLARYNEDEAFSRDAFLDAVLELAGARGTSSADDVTSRRPVAEVAAVRAGGDPRFRDPQRRPSRRAGTAAWTATGIGAASAATAPVSILSRTR